MLGCEYGKLEKTRAAEKSRCPLYLGKEDVVQVLLK
jgi:hypothetical protein